MIIIIYSSFRECVWHVHEMQFKTYYSRKNVLDNNHQWHIEIKFRRVGQFLKLPIGFKIIYKLGQIFFILCFKDRFDQNTMLDSE